VVTIDTNGNIHLVIRDPNGFNLQGLPVDGVPRNGLVHEVQSAGDVTRSTAALLQDGVTPIQFTSADLALAGPVAAGETFTVTLNGVPFSYVAGSNSDPLTRAAVADGLAAAITSGGYTVGSPGESLSVSRAAAFTVEFSINGVAPHGSRPHSTCPARRDWAKPGP
jgi:hypothetical protein